MGNATRKQIDALRKMGYSVAEDISFEDASRMFDEHKAKKNPQAVVPVVQGTTQKTGTYHLTPEQVNTNAVECAQRWYPNIPNSLDEIKNFWLCVHDFEKYIKG